MNKLGFSGMRTSDQRRSLTASASGIKKPYQTPGSAAGSSKSFQMPRRPSCDSISMGSFVNLKVTAEKLVKEQASVKTDLDMAVSHIQQELKAVHSEEVKYMRRQAEDELKNKTLSSKKEHKVQLRAVRYEHEEECQKLQEELELQKSKEERQRALLQLQWKVMDDNQQQDQEVNTKKQIHEEVRDCYMIPQLTSDVMKPLQIEQLLDQKVVDISGSKWQRVAFFLCLGKTEEKNPLCFLGKPAGVRTHMWAISASVFLSSPSLVPKLLQSASYCYRWYQQVNGSAHFLCNQRCLRASP